MLLQLLLLIAVTERFGSAIQIDNGVIGLPQVTCGDDQVTMVFSTQRPFTGRIFIKGMADKADCSSSFRNNGASSVTFQLKGGGNCNMRRQRRVGPQRGVEQSMTVIISFHDTFITKVDRAYRCTCFFMEADKVVTSQIDVSALPTTDIFDTARMPLCTYHVRRGSLNGPVVSYARVGEGVYHVWQCDGAMFGMLVHSCFVDDTEGQNKFQLSDQNGCAIDQVILGDLTYNHELNQAYVETQVAKFADKVAVYFQCAISMCLKNDGACVGVTPPQCNRTRARFRREVMASQFIDSSSALASRQDFRSAEKLFQLDNAFDVASDKIVVLDLDDDVPQASGSLTAVNSGSVIPGQRSSVEIWRNNDVCLTTQGFALLLAVFGLATTTAVVASTIVCLRHFSAKTSTKH